MPINVSNRKKNKPLPKSKRPATSAVSLANAYRSDPSVRAYAALLNDPCNADLVTVPGTVGKGFGQRFSGKGSITIGAGSDTLFMCLCPQTALLYMVGVTLGTTATNFTQLDSVTFAGPGRLWLATNTASFRGLAGCLSISSGNPISAIRGNVYTGLIKASTLTTGKTFSQLLDMLPRSQRLGMELLETKWYGTEMDNINYTETSTTSQLISVDSHLVVTMVTGLAVGDVLQWTAVNAIEWFPIEGQGLMVNSSPGNVSPFRANASLSILSASTKNWWTNVGRGAQQLYKFVSDASPYAAAIAAML